MPIRPSIPPRPPAPSAPHPQRTKTGAPKRTRNVTDVPLQLVIGRQGVGLELAAPVVLGAIAVTELTASLPGIRFPVDVSGGVPRFRHRRGELQTIQVEASARMLERWAAPRLRGVVGARVPEVWIGVRDAGATICVAQVVEADDARAKWPVAPVVSFDVDVIAEESDLHFVVRRARGTDLPAPATAIAMACAEAILGDLARREGAVFVLRNPAQALARALLPEAGARVPAAQGVNFVTIAAHAESWILRGMRGSLAAAPLEEAVRGREIAAMLREGDDALGGGDHEKAREMYLLVLERAPRHGEIARRILEIDARTPGRAEAALATLAEAGQVGDGRMPETHFGTTPGELLAEIGDVDAAVASFERAGATDPAPAIAARAFELAARLTDDAENASLLLDRAMAIAPRSTTARWLRIVRRLELGRLDDAMADVEHLDAQARGGRPKFAVWMRAGRAWQAAGLGKRAAALFERALRHAPDEPDALAGLGAGLVAEGRKARGVAVLARAIEIAEARRSPTTAPILLELARALAEHLDDLPTAIARVAGIGADTVEGPVARGLEGRWRARLGDVAGAALAFARLRELATSLAAPNVPATMARSLADTVSTPTLVGLLVEAADMHRSRLHDPLGAQRYLAAALRLSPHDVSLRRAYREIGTLVARRDDAFRESSPPESAAFADIEEGSAVHESSATERPSGSML